MDRAGTVSGAEASGVAGEAAAIYDVSNTSNHDLTTIIPIAILAIGVLLALVLRSLIAPLYLIVSVGLSYLAALGLIDDRVHLHRGQRRDQLSSCPSSCSSSCWRWARTTTSWS